MDRKTRSSVIIGGTAVSISAILWGFDGVVLTPRLYNLDVGFVVFMIHAIPFVLMNVFLYRQYRHLKTFTGNDFLILALIALLGGSLGTIAIVKALFLVNFQKLTIVVLLQKLQPVFAIALAAIFLKEKIGKNYVVWAALAIVAGYFLTFGLKTPNLETGANTVYASMFALLAALSFGSSTVLSKRILEKYSFHTATFYRYGFTTLIMFFFVLFTAKFVEFKDITTENWIIFLVIAVTTGSGAIFLYYYGLKKVRAIIATICELFFPLSAIIFDYVFNNQQLSLVQWLSAAVMIFAIVNLNISNRKRKLKSP
ncbi:MAG: DMT family transporter [Bacteroidales bacterium]|nr:DMT family transporter [Bacteroidales bacterium]MCF8377854.1 DMT family transporter [Bacteroidales bacterium]